MITFMRLTQRAFLHLTEIPPIANDMIYEKGKWLQGFPAAIICGPAYSHYAAGARVLKRKPDMLVDPKMNLGIRSQISGSEAI